MNSSYHFRNFTTGADTTAGFHPVASCDASRSLDVLTAACVGKQSCSVNASSAVFGGDPCPNVHKMLAGERAGFNCRTYDTHTHTHTCQIVNVRRRHVRTLTDVCDNCAQGRFIALATRRVPRVSAAATRMTRTSHTLCTFKRLK
jgi:hypothetical protein